VHRVLGERQGIDEGDHQGVYERPACGYTMGR
jgi:hypothetical protein